MGKRIKMFAVATILAMVIVSFSPLASAADGDMEIPLLRAEVDIDNSYAITEITVTFKNPTSTPKEEVFSFSIPEDAFVSNFSLTLKGKTYYADIMKADKAKDDYERAKDQGSNAGLLETFGKATFSYAVNVAAKDEVTVTLRYEDFIERCLDGFKYELGLSSYTERTIGALEVFVDMDYDRTITDVKAESYGNATEITMENADHSARLVYTDADLKPTEDYIVTWDVEGLPVNGRMLFHEEAMADGGGYFLHVFNPGVVELGGYLPKDIVFVLDRSGSMGGDKIAYLKEAFSGVVKQLRSDDKFEVVTFSSDVTPVYNKMVRATDVNRNDASKKIGQIDAGGGTNIHDALLKALDILKSSEERVPVIVFLTDGLISNNDQVRKDVMANNKMGASIYVLAMGSNVQWEFLRALALENNGFARRVQSSAEAKSQINDFYNTISLPLLRNTDFSYTEGTYAIYPTHIDNLYEGNEIVVVGKYDRSMTQISFQATTMTSEGARTFEDTFAVDTSGEASFIMRYWAYAMIRYYQDEITVNGETDELVENLTNIALEHGFVTEYTSLMVEIPKEDLVDQPKRELPALAYEGGYATGTSPSKDAGDLGTTPGFDMLLVLPALALVAIFVAWRARRKD